MDAHELQWAQEVLAIVNVERANNGLQPVQWHDTASQVAYMHALDMDVRNYFAHDNPDGLSPGDRLTAGGVNWTGWGENIARGQDNPAAVMNAWMNSPGHRSNILNSIFTHLGVGVHEAGGGPWWVQNFVRE
jgi:uncharacterized protein YkwD